jgi:endonuclease/exonuclease/phosphatase family metal-dependent hydrolase
VHSIKEKSSWYQTFVYGANKAIDRQSLWQNLLSMKVRVASNPWILCGDFNVVRTLAEKWGSEQTELV